MVSFTGSTETGRRFLRYAADSNLKRVVLECGGKNPAVVFDDAEDLDLVAEQVVLGAFWNMGENCSATSRLIVHASVKDELLGRIAAPTCASGAWATRSTRRTGSARSSAASTSTKVKSYIDQDPGTTALGWSRAAGRRCFIEPTVVDGVTRESSRSSGGGLRAAPLGHDLLERVRGDSTRQRHALRPRGLGLHRQPATGAQGGARDPGRHGDGELLRRGRHHHPLRRLQGIRLRRARQVDLRPRPVHRAQDDLDRRLATARSTRRSGDKRVVRRLPVDTGRSGWQAISASQPPSGRSTAT